MIDPNERDPRFLMDLQTQRVQAGSSLQYQLPQIIDINTSSVKVILRSSYSFITLYSFINDNIVEVSPSSSTPSGIYKVTLILQE